MRRIILFLAVVAVAAADAIAATQSTPEGIRFTYTSTSVGQVFLAGAFNEWSATANPMVRDGDRFSIVIKLAPGEHEYKFVVDGNWVADPDNPTTSGAYGNSAIRVGADGELLEMEPTSNTPLSPKILLSGRYIGLFIGREDPSNNRRFSVSRPDFTFDLDLAVRISEAASARVLTKIRNAAEETPLWETSVRFDRGHIDVHRPGFAVRVFDNDGIGSWEDPLHLVGNVGRYGRDFGYQQQGVRARAELAGVAGEFVYADNFETGGVTFPPVETPPADGSSYNFNLQATNKNVLALRLERELASGLTFGGTFRNDRGYNPGAFSRSHTEADGSTRLEVFPNTTERWAGGGADIRIAGQADQTRGFAEILYGEAWVSTGSGVGVVADSNGTVIGGFTPESGSVPLDRSLRWTLGGRLQLGTGTAVTASVENERHELAEAATDSGRTFDNSALAYRAGLELDLEERLDLPLRLGVELEVVDFTYPADAPWNTQLWFADRNFWLENDQHRLLVPRYVQLGGEDATTWSPWLAATLWRRPETTFRYDGAFRSQQIDQKIELWESQFRLEIALSPALRFASQVRWARYAEPVLGVHSGFASNFTELEYSFTPDISLALSYGVDPFILDLVTNEYDEIGINEFLIANGADPNTARDQYLRLSTDLVNAERALEDERRIQLEAIFTF